MHSPPLTWMVGPTMNLISGTHHSCERGTMYLFVVMDYWIIFLIWDEEVHIYCTPKVLKNYSHKNRYNLKIPEIEPTPS